MTDDWLDAHDLDGDPDGGPSGLLPASRRVVLLGAASGVGVLGTSSAAVAALPLVRPQQSQVVLNALGVNAKPNFLKSGYGNYRAWLGAMKRMGITSFRGNYARGLPQTLDVVREARRLGIGWDMVVAPDIDIPSAEIRRTLRHIAVHAADVCRSVKGVNEPNYTRGRGPVRGDWETGTLRVQRVIWDYVQSDRRLRRVRVVGPTLQDQTATPSDFRRLARRGILETMDVGAIHSYPGGHFPDFNLGERLSTLRSAWPGKPIWVAETGYNNALASTTGHRAVPEWVAAAYGPSVLLEAVDRGTRIAFFELLDDPDPGAKDNAEANFGLLATRRGSGPPWRPKPIVNTLREFLLPLRDPGPGFRPARIRFKATGPADLRTTLTAKRNGVVTAHLRRATDCWDPVDRRRINVTAARVKIETASGTRFVRVDHEVTSIRL